MGIRVVARIRPQQAHELDKDVIVMATAVETDTRATLVKIPSHKNDHEMYTFSFSGVYDQRASQQSIFDNEGKFQRKRDMFDFQSKERGGEVGAIGVSADCFRSGADHQASFQWVRCYNLRVWLDWNREDSYNARGQNASRAWGHSTIAIWYLSKG